MATLVQRRHRDGSVSYQVRWRLGGGRAGSGQSETFTHKRAAASFKRDVEAFDHLWPEGWVPGFGYRAGAEPVSERRSETPFAQFAAEHVAALTGIQPDTRLRYTRQVARLVGQLADVLSREPTVEGLNARHVKQWVNARERAGASPKTIANYHGLLFSILAAAIEEGLIDTNPCAKTRLPRSDTDIDADESKVFLTREQFELVRGYAKPDVRDLLTVAVGTGLRWGEISALQVRDLELDAETPRLAVRRAWKRLGGEPVAAELMHNNGRHYLGTPKSKKSRRRVTLAPELVGVLRGCTAGKAPTDFVFTNRSGGALDQAHFYEGRWAPAVTAAQAAGLTVRPRFHDLRHSHVISPALAA